MFDVDYYNYIRQVILNKNEGSQYSVSVANEVDYELNNKADIEMNVYIGQAVPIEGAKHSKVCPFSLVAYGERGDGAYTKRLLNFVYEELCWQSKNVKAEDETKSSVKDVYYKTFASLTTPTLMSSMIESSYSYRNSYIVQGSIIFSINNIVGIKYEIQLYEDEYDEEKFSEIEIINPSYQRNLNLEARSTVNGVRQFSNGLSEASDISFVLGDNGIDTETMLGIVYGSNEDYIREYVALKITYGQYSIIKMGLKISSTSIRYDETTRNSIITISFVKEDVRNQWLTNTQ